MGNRTRHVSGAVLLAGALALTACGVGSQSDSDATDAPAVTESSGTTADTTAATTADTTATTEATADTAPAETTADTHGGHGGAARRRDRHRGGDRGQP